MQLVPDDRSFDLFSKIQYSSHDTCTDMHTCVDNFALNDSKQLLIL